MVLKRRFKLLSFYITGSALALHCDVKNRQSQWRSPNFNPPVKFTPLKFSRPNSAHVTTSRTSTPVPNFIAISLRVASPKYVKYYAFVTFCCPVLSMVILFSLATLPRSNPGRILTIYGLNDASSPKNVPFGGLDNGPLY